MIGCFFNPAKCLNDGLSSFAEAFLSLFPFGFTGLVFFVGLIAGERLGKWGVMGVIIGWIAYRFGKTAVGQDPIEHFDRHPDPAPKPVPRPVEQRKHRTLAEAFDDIFGRR